MNTYIALFRGINVGGKNLLPMKELVSVLEGIGLCNVRTYIQSGNVVFDSAKHALPELAQEIGQAIETSHGFAPQVLLLEPADLQEAIAINPYPEAQSEPTTLHVAFLFATPVIPDLEKLEKIKTDSERFALKGRIFYLNAPDGIARSKVAVNVERSLGVAATMRNWRSVIQIAAMAKRSP